MNERKIEVANIIIHQQKAYVHHDGTLNGNFSCERVTIGDRIGKDLDKSCQKWKG